MKKKVTLREYAIMIEKSVMEAKRNAEAAGALEIDFDNIYVIVDDVENYMDNEIIDCLKDVNGICTQ